MAYESLENDQGHGANVLFGDGHVEFLTTPAAQRVVTELEAGHNPPRLAGSGGSP